MNKGKEEELRIIAGRIFDIKFKISKLKERLDQEHVYLDYRILNSILKEQEADYLNVESSPDGLY